MPDLEPVKARIRFHLAELSTRNEHHAFERLCQEVTRARICENILPATGPVSAGGDQGRDFETFKTYLEKSLVRDTTFLGPASEGILVFTCTTQKDPADSKIYSDVGSIMASGETPARIYFFCTDNVPVGRRHAVQEKVWQDHGVRLEILDGHALAEHLSDPDLFWVALEFLNLSREDYPFPLESARGVTREGLEARSRLDDADARRFTEWLAAVTSSFVVPGLGVSLPIGKAWIGLRAHADPGWVGDPPGSLQKWLEVYREWGRLAERGSAADRVFGAEQVVHVGRRVVVVGGPGAGKSTLLKRLAHRLAAAVEDVLLVRLPMVLRVMDGGHSFEEAVVKVAADGSGLDEATARRVLGRPGYLLADGLDECDPRRQLVADSLRGWSEGHPDAKVVVTTRPVGHNPAHLPEWGYVELLPLAGSRVREYAGLLLESIPLPEGSDIEERLDAFERSLEDNGAVSLAARNPLLLGFLVQLFASGVGFGESRAGLYRRIIEQMVDRPLHDREPRVEVHAEVARFSFGAIGWILQHEQDLSRRDLVEKLGELLRKELGGTGLAGRCEADKCLRFWEERRVIERLTAGFEDAVRFLHLGLAEYAASVFVSGLDDGTLRDWVRKVRRKPRWRETLLLAAGAGAVDSIAAALLEFENRDDPAAVETELALAALAEVPAAPRELVREAASHLRERLTADVPLVAFEATEVALGLASQAPEIVGPVVRPLTGHPQEWTRMCAIRLALACGGGWADLDALEAFVDETVSGASREAASEDRRLGQRRGIFTWGFEQKMLLEGIERLLRERPGEDTTRRIERMYLWEFIGTGTFEKLTDLLRRHGGHNDLIKKAHERHGYGLLNAEKWLRDERERKDKDLAVLEAILRATDVPREADLPEPTGELTELSKLVYGMGWLDAAVTAVDVMRHRRDLDVVDAVFRGAIAALELDPTRLAAEAALAKSRFEEDDGLVSGRLWSQVVELPTVPRWELTSDADLPAEDLVRALKHPSAPIVNNAVALLEHGAGGAAVPALLERVARTGTEYTSHATAYLAPRIWGEQALDKLLDILGDGPVTPENRGMLLTLPDLPGAEDDDRVLRLFARGLMSEDPDAATDVAEELFKTQSLNLSPMIAQMEEALEHWTGHGTWCDRDDIPVYGSSCPRCSTIPRSPRGHLIRILAGLGGMQPERLADLTADSRHDVREAATEALAEAAASSPPMLDDVLARVGSGELQPAMLDKTLSLPPAPLQESKGALTALLGSPSADVRERVLGAMAGLHWIGREEAVDLARGALRDRVPAVRDQAAKILRRLRSG